MKKKARLIAFYLPQYYPIPENDKWHGKGFTEWANVTKARPLFRGHYQPILPADLGYYDLRVPETRIAQARLAEEYGIEAFCYWHYWFGNGKRLLERPFVDVLTTGEPDFPFCLAWANASWTGTWYGMSDTMLLEQTYPGKDDCVAHFYSLLDAFRDKRYLTVNGKQLFFIFDPHELKQHAAYFTELWQELAKQEGLKGLYFIGATFTEEKPVHDGFEGSVQLAPFECLPKNRLATFLQYELKIDISKILAEIFNRPKINEYEELVSYLERRNLWKNEFPLVMPNWDNTARCGAKGSVLHNGSPELFGQMLDNALQKISHIANTENRLIFIQSWNEWAEGNYLEPDKVFGQRYLEVIKKRIVDSKNTAQ